MGKPKYTLPSEQRTHREQPLYETPEGFTHAEEYLRKKDTMTEQTIPLEAVVPIPVTVVDTPRGPERVVSYNTTNYNVMPGAEVTISRNDNRKNLRLVNNDAAKTLYVNSKAGLSTQGFPLLPGKEWPTTSTREVYVYNPDAAATVNVGVSYDLVTELA